MQAGNTLDIGGPVQDEVGHGAAAKGRDQSRRGGGKERRGRGRS